MRMTKREKEERRQRQHVFFFALTDKPPNAMKKTVPPGGSVIPGARKKQIKNCAVVLIKLADHPKVLVASRRALAMSIPIPTP